MSLSVYMLIFSLFFVRVLSLNVEVASKIKAHEIPDTELLTYASSVMLLKLYMGFNLTEYFLSVIYFTASISIYERMHSLDCSPRFLRRYLVYSWVFNFFTQSLGVLLVFNDDVDLLQKQDMTINDYYKLCRTMVGTRIALYFIISVTLLVLCCLYICIIILQLNNLRRRTQAQERRKDERSRKLSAFLQAKAEEFEYKPNIGEEEKSCCSICLGNLDEECKQY